MRCHFVVARIGPISIGYVMQNKEKTLRTNQLVWQ